MDEKIGVINIRDFIGNCNDFVGMFLIDIIKQFKSQPETNVFKIYIESKGGDIIEAFKIRDYFQSLIKEGYTLMTIGDKIVASSATIIHQSGSEGKRFLLPNCEFMIHSPSGEVKGNTHDIVSYGEMITEITGLMSDVYEQEMSLPKDIILDMMANETYFKAEDCEALGFAQVYNEKPIVARAK